MQWQGGKRKRTLQKVKCVSKRQLDQSEKKGKKTAKSDPAQKSFKKRGERRERA